MRLVPNIADAITGRAVKNCEVINIQVLFIVYLAVARKWDRQNSLKIKSYGSKCNPLFAVALFLSLPFISMASFSHFLRFSYSSRSNSLSLDISKALQVVHWSFLACRKLKHDQNCEKFDRKQIGILVLHFWWYKILCTFGT